MKHIFLDCWWKDSTQSHSSFIALFLALFQQSLQGTAFPTFSNYPVIVFASNWEHLAIFPTRCRRANFTAKNKTFFLITGLFTEWRTRSTLTAKLLIANKPNLCRCSWPALAWTRIHRSTVGDFLGHSKRKTTSAALKLNQQWMMAALADQKATRRNIQTRLKLFKRVGIFDSMLLQVYFRRCCFRSLTVCFRFSISSLSWPSRRCSFLTGWSCTPWRVICNPFRETFTEARHP